MWHEKQEGIILPGQTMHTPVSQGAFMENKILTPHSGTSESSRKRKLIAVDMQHTISESVHEYGFPKEIEENSLELFLNQSQLSIKTVGIRNQSKKDQFDGQNTLRATRQNCNGYYRNGPEKISIASPSVLPQSDQASNCEGIEVASTVGPGSLLAPASVEQKYKNDMSLQNELQFSSGPFGVGLGDNYKKENGRAHGDSNSQIVKKEEGSEVENTEHSLEETSPRNGSCSAAVNIRHDLTHGSLKCTDRRKLLVRKVASTFAEKLWDGSLQLNSSVNVFAVAFFKSGERMPNIKWCESVEVKGKVRLEAFEKYIQDLPRSRNRGLMVISLCWKEGSSKTGLAGMKKVAKGYKEGERVGFAQLSPGIDLYICPRSETIITILAKHGFFKGMAAVEDNQDSLIGCVVWRRNRATSNTDVKKLNKKSCSLTERPVNSPSDSSAQRSAENNLSHTQPAEESIPVASATDYATLESIGNNSIESKNVKHSNAQLEFHNPSISSKPLPTPSVPSDSLSVSVGIKTSGSDCDSHQGSLGQSLEVEAPQMHNSGTKKRKPSLELQTPVLSLPSDVTKKVVSVPDDDDLPEFDFGTSSGISQTITSKPLDAYIREKKLSAEGFRNIDRSLPPTVSLIVNHRRLENSNIAQLPLGAFQKKTPLKNFCESKSISRFPIMEGKHTAQTIAVTTRGSTSAVPCAKNLFHDDDDMPEWCPPDVELHRQSVPKTNWPLTTSINFKVPNSMFESFHATPSPLLPSTSRVAIPPPFATQTLPSAYNCLNEVTMRPVQPRPAVGHMQRGPTSLMRFNSNSLLTPTLNTFDVKFPIHHAGWRG